MVKEAACAQVDGADASAPVGAGRHNLLASPDPGELGDHHRDPRQDPQVGVELISPGARQQGLLDLGELSGRQLGIRAGRPAAAQGVHAALGEAGGPHVDALAGDAELVGDLGLGTALGEQLGRLQSSGLAGGALLLGLGRREVGIAGPSHSINPAVNPTHG
jgi:hypothetical protein